MSSYLDYLSDEKLGIGSSHIIGEIKRKLQKFVKELNFTKQPKKKLLQYIINSKEDIIRDVVDAFMYVYMPRKGEDDEEIFNLKRYS